jgi:hypothetical protein
MHAFDRATAVDVRAGQQDAGQPDIYDANIDPNWTIGGKPNGGYLLAMMTKAAIANVKGHPHPLAASAHFVRAPSPGPVELRTSTLRVGRSASQVRVSALQDGQPCIEAVLTIGELDASAQPWWTDVPIVELPDEDHCIRLPPRVPTSGVEVALQRMIEVRLDPKLLGFAEGRPGGQGELRGWLRFADGRQPDPLSLVFAADSFPPATFDLGSIGWVPTLELTVYVRGVPSPGPLRVRQRAQLIQQGFLDEVCEVWDSAGRLVVQATQLAGVRVPDQPPPSL